MPIALVLGSLLAASQLPPPSTGRGDGGLAADFVIQVNAGPEAVSCPQTTQVFDALTVRMPNLMRQRPMGDATPVLGLSLSRPEAGSLRVELRDGHGAIVLERVLETSPPGGNNPYEPAATADCVALADTIALIVERYLRQIGYRGTATLPLEPVAPVPSVASTSSTATPPSAAPTPSVTPRADAPQRRPSSLASQPVPLPDRTWRGLVGAGVALSAPIRGLGGDARWVRFANLVGNLQSGRVVVSASVGVGEPTETASIPLTDGGSLHVVPMPLRAGIGFVIHAGRGSVIPGIAGGVDWLWTSTRRIDGEHPLMAIEPAVEGGASYLRPLGRGFWIKPQVVSVLNLRPHDFVLEGDSSRTVFRTARLYLRAGIDIGFEFGQD